MLAITQILPEYEPELKLSWLEAEVERLLYLFFEPPPTIFVRAITSPIQICILRKRTKKISHYLRNTWLFKYFGLPDPPEAFRLLSPFAAASTSYIKGVKSVAFKRYFLIFMCFSLVFIRNDIVYSLP